MADEKDKKPSADEIVDNMAEEMGVKDEKVPEGDGLSKCSSSGLEGIFDVAPKKKKKKDPEPEESDDSDDSAEASSGDDSSTDEAEEKPKKKKKASIEGVFDPSGDAADDGGFDVGEDGFLGEDDLGDYQPKAQIGRAHV